MADPGSGAHSAPSSPSDVRAPRAGRPADAFASLGARGPLAFSFALLGLVALAGWLRFWALDFGLPHPGVRPDETQILDATLQAAREGLDIDFLMYPHAYVYLSWAWGASLLALSQLLGLASPGSYAEIAAREPAQLYLLLRGLAALSGTATVVVLVRMVRRDSGPAAGLVAGLLLATCFLHVRDSHSFKPDALLALAILVAVAASARLARLGDLQSALLAGLAAGVAASVKATGFAALLVVYMGAVWGSRAAGVRRLVPGTAFAGGAALIGVAALTSPYMFFDAAYLDTLLHGLHAIFPGWVGAPAMQPFGDLTKLEGPAPPVWAAGVFGSAIFHLRISFVHGLGWLPSLLAPFALVWGLATRRPLPALAAAFSAAYFVLISASPAMLTRYVTPIVPLIALLEAGLLAALAARVPGPRARQGLLLAAALLLAAGPLARAIEHDRLLSRPDTRVLAERWLAEHGRAGERVAVLGTRFWAWGAPRVLPPLEPALEPVEQAVRSGRIDWLVTHDHELYWSRVDPLLLARLRPRLREAVDFDPAARGARAAPLFEFMDAYYAPLARMHAVERAGPRVRIYRVD